MATCMRRQWRWQIASLSLYVLRSGPKTTHDGLPTEMPPKRRAG